jgi:hypothetical protein
MVNHVDAASAASLLIACLADVRPAETPRAVEVYSGLKPRNKGGFGKSFPTLDFVAKSDTFGQAIESLLLLAPRFKQEALTILLALFDEVPPEDLLSLEFFELTITLQRPVPYVRMTVSAINDSGLCSHKFSQEWTVDSEKLRAGYYKPESRARTDLRTESTITHKTIFRLGDLLAADSTKEHDDEEASRTAGSAQPESRADATAARQGGSREPRSYGYRDSGLRLTEG